MPIKTELLRQFNENLDKAVKFRDTNIQQITRKLGWGQNRIYDYQAARRNISFEDIEDIARVLEISPFSLVCPESAFKNTCTPQDAINVLSELVEKFERQKEEEELHSRT